MALKVGDKAPDFVLASTSGNKVRLSKALPCIVYFYPKDFTPGCTKEACAFRDGYQELAELNINVFGVSKDSVKSHEKFIRTHQLPFELLSDPKGAVCKEYNALIPVLNIPKRITYLIDENQKIKAVFNDMFDAKAHVAEMISNLS